MKKYFLYLKESMTVASKPIVDKAKVMEMSYSLQKLYNESSKKRTVRVGEINFKSTLRRKATTIVSCDPPRKELTWFNMELGKGGAKQKEDEV